MATHTPLSGLPSHYPYNATKRQQQLKELPQCIKNISKLFKPVDLPIEHSLLSEFVHWIIRNDYVHGNTIIDSLVGGIFMFFWSASKPDSSILASKIHVDKKIIFDTEDKWVDTFATFRFHYSITVSYKKNTQVLSWDTNDVESPIHPVAKITTRIRQIFDLNYPPRCYIVEKKRTQSSLVGCKWIPSQTYVIVENKEEIKDYKHKHKTTASSTTSASDKDSSVALTSDMDDLDI